MVWVKRLAALVFIVVLLGGFWARHMLRSSLAQLDGEAILPGLSKPAIVERDALGVATITGESRSDVARALGFVHAQERFFQMDLSRRQAAGELAALFGEAALPLDRRHRLHRMRRRAEKSVSLSRGDDDEISTAYTDGVNAGLKALEAPPFEYLLLRQTPEPWRVEDSLLVVAAMFFVLNDAGGRYEAAQGLIHDVLPPQLAEFLSPLGTDWDAPVVGDVIPTPPIPSPDSAGSWVPKTARHERGGCAQCRGELWREDVGSNNWVLAGARTKSGRGLLASDMHLAHSVPNIWFRALLSWGGHRVVGVTLPGTPFMVAGSNTHIAWGFTNTNGDWSDLVELELDPEDPSRYRTPDGWKPFTIHEERIEVSGATAAEVLEIRETIWGPVLDEDHRGRLRAIRWIAHEIDAVTTGVGALETATSLDDALAVAQQSGMPPQNFVGTDAAGAIAWTVAGRIPARFGFDGRRPSSWADGTRGWNGWLAPEDYPVIKDPESGAIWTANARVVDGEMLAKIGDGGYAFGARARQIRDALAALENATEQDMLNIQLDDRALFMDVWRQYFVEWVPAHISEAIENGWTGHASIDASGYRIVRELRLAIFEEVFSTLTAEAREADERFSVWSLRQWDGPLFKLVSEKPEHLVPHEYASWDAWMMDIVERTVASWEEPLASRRWGDVNQTAVKHPLSRAVWFLSRWLDMPSRPIPGDSNMPRAQGTSHGISERLVVSPGQEENGLLHMPGGQSGHPLSPFYGAGHEDWEQGLPTPLLPGVTLYSLTLNAN
ncbi:MAG: penicillin acylase family protein [Acidobacteria bacterium]|nr:MAG: penicillin acylase family protein [Acidobacteriota bacterium]